MKKLILFILILVPLIGFAHNYDDVRNEIVRAVDPWSEGKRNSRQARPFANKIINGLYLGNDEKFAETLGIPCRNVDNKKIDSSNPNKFEVIISLCTYQRMAKEMPDLKKVRPATVEKNFKERNIVWMQLGRSLPDDKKAWSDLVYNATFPNSKLAKQDLEIPKNSKNRQHVEFRKSKQRKVAEVAADKWFEPTFKMMDEAVLHGKKTLIHCHAGASRSPTLVAAYLINRYGVNAKQAVAFLRSKRNCSNPKCMEDLEKYAKKLKDLK